MSPFEAMQNLNRDLAFYWSRKMKKKEKGKDDEELTQNSIMLL